MNLLPGEMARLKKIEAWLDEQKILEARVRRFARRLAGLMNLMFATEIDPDDRMVPLSNTEWLLNLIKRELERK